MKTFFLRMTYLSVALSLPWLPAAEAAGSSADVFIQGGKSRQHEDPAPGWIEASAVRWEAELDRVAFALVERALSEAGDDALVQSLLARADHLRVQRAQLQQCAAQRPSELARVLRGSIEGTPEGAPKERDLVTAALERSATSAAP